MKTAMSTLVSVMIAIAGIILLQTPSFAQNDATVKVICSAETADLANSLAGIYKQSNSDVQLKVAQVASGEIDKNVPDNQCIALLHENPVSEKMPKGFKNIVIGRNIYVWVINSESKYVEMICEKGVLLDDLMASMKTGQISYPQVNDVSENSKVFVSKTATSEAIFSPMFKSSELISNDQIEIADRITDAVQQNPYAIGFCRLNEVIDPQSGELAQGITLMPIDKNKNGNLDDFENIYQSIDDFTRGVWMGKYPGALVSELYAVVPGQPSAATRDFTSWLITDEVVSAAF